MGIRIVCLSGVDGSGKSTIIAELARELESRGQKVRCVWLRYNHYTTKLVLALARFTGLTRYEHFPDSRVVYHDFHRSSAISWLFVATTFLDTLLASVARVYLPVLFGQRLILCDRWVLDILVDLAVDTKIDFSKKPRISQLFRYLIPGSARCFVITRDFASARSAREESRKDRNFPHRYELYQRYIDDGQVRVIENQGSIRNSVRQILDNLK